MCLTRLRRQDRLGEVASLLADSDVGASRGGLFDDGRQLSGLLGAPATVRSEAVVEAWRGRFILDWVSKPGRWRQRSPSA